mmetsp:Transcript_64254/g.135032  ORF Transcript_64254/g.135032 Transcript_64254/m.135032 type:complete len:235 (+) Transcript_64254:737-1441(+)
MARLLLLPGSRHLRETRPRPFACLKLPAPRPSFLAAGTIIKRKGIDGAVFFASLLSLLSLLSMASRGKSKAGEAACLSMLFNRDSLTIHSTTRVFLSMRSTDKLSFPMSSVGTSSRRDGRRGKSDCELDSRCTTGDEAGASPSAPRRGDGLLSFVVVVAGTSFLEEVGRGLVTGTPGGGGGGDEGGSTVQGASWGGFATWGGGIEEAPTRGGGTVGMSHCPGGGKEAPGGKGQL